MQLSVRRVRGDRGGLTKGFGMFDKQCAFLQVGQRRVRMQGLCIASARHYPEPCNNLFEAFTDWIDLFFLLIFRILSLDEL